MVAAISVVLFFLSLTGHCLQILQAGAVKITCEVAGKLPHFWFLCVFYHSGKCSRDSFQHLEEQMLESEEIF